MLLIAAAFSAPLAEMPAKRDLVDIFIDACVRGEARLERGQAEIVSADVPPSWLRSPERAGVTTTYLEIKSPAKAFLVTLKYQDPQRHGIEDQCILASRFVAPSRAIGRLTGLLSGGRIRNPASSKTVAWQMDAPQHRYVMRVSRSHPYTVMSTTVLDEAEAARRAEAQRKYWDRKRSKRRPRRERAE